MVIDFSKTDLRKRPNFILRNFDGKAIGALGHVLRPKADIYYNEISKIEFEYPAYVNGERLNEYDLLTGMRIIDVDGIGQFTLHNPEETTDGVKIIKMCSGYSLEYEFTNKSLSLQEGTYNFWNPFTPESTILGIILSEMPSWSVGTVSPNLVGKYRTFSVDNVSIYDFMKSELEKTYECIFDFDTYNRRINVKSNYDIIATKPVYISTSNLAKEIEIEEDIDNLFTVLDVNGADGVDIRAVNPMGINKIYNLDSYMNTKYFSSSMITKWNNWKNAFISNQNTYYSLVVAQNMQISRYETESAVLRDLQGELSGLETKKGTLLQAVAIDKTMQSQLNTTNSQIQEKNNEIEAQKNLLKQIKTEIDAYKNQLKQINNTTAFSSFFSDSELLLLDRYFKCGSLTDSSFVANSTGSYSTDAKIVRKFSSIFNLTRCNTVTKTTYAGDITFYTVRGGIIEENSSALKLKADVVSGTLQVNNDKTFVMSLYLSEGSVNGDTFPSGTLSLTGTLSTGATFTDTSLQFKTSTTTAYMTYEVSEYQRMSIAWELYEYGREVLDKKASPVYHFTVDSSNFLVFDDFLMFAREFELGKRIYLHLTMGVLEPLVTGVSIEFDDLSSFKLEFASDFQIKNGKFSLLDNLDQSNSASKTLDFNQFNYSNFVNSGAKTSIKEFMESAIDAMKNMILAGTDNEITIDQAGLRCRKFDSSTGTYSPKQIWLQHNAMMFTNDNWVTGVIGIGEFVDKNLGTIYGIVAPAIVGTILAGENLVIESAKQDGGISVFKVDAEGASLHNASFNLYGNTGGRIDMGAVFGIVGGADKNTLFYYNSKGQPTGVRTTGNRSITSLNNLAAGDTPVANFWLDMKGNAYFKGKLIATSGQIGGFTIESSYLHAGSGNNYVALNGGNSVYSEYAIWAGAQNPASAPFWVKKNGDVSMKNADVNGTINAKKFLIDGKDALSGNKIKEEFLHLEGITSIVEDKERGLRSEISQTAESINTRVTNLNANLSSQITQTASAINSRVDDVESGLSSSITQTAKSIRTEIKGLDGKVSSLEQTVDGFDFGGFVTFRDLERSGKTEINGDNITTGTIDLSLVTLEDTEGFGSISTYSGSTGSGRTYGIRMNGPFEEIYVTATSSACRMTADDNNFYVAPNRTHSDVAIDEGSDERIKNTIRYDVAEHYSEFYRKLKPARYHRNDGMSGRFHTGFIAQQMRDALNESNLTQQDFAALVQQNYDSSAENGGDGIYSIRYCELISLNTAMIQKLMNQIDELKAEIKEVK